MQQLLGQALEHEFPAAPQFETEIKSSKLKKVYELVLPATESPMGGVPIEKTQRLLLRQMANPLCWARWGSTRRTSCWGSTGRPTFCGRPPKPAAR